MGGQYTETVQQKASPEPEPEASKSDMPVSPSRQAGQTGQAEQGSTIEMHVANGEAHFHDRTSGLKVAVPAAEWYEVAKDKFLRMRHSAGWSYWDRVNNTKLFIEMYVAGDRVCTTIMIVKLSPDDVTAGFMRFIDKSVLGKNT